MMMRSRSSSPKRFRLGQGTNGIPRQISRNQVEQTHLQPAKPRFRLSSTISFRRRNIKQEREPSSESSEDIRFNMQTAKSPKSTGNFAAAYRSGATEEKVKSEKPNPSSSSTNQRRQSRLQLQSQSVKLEKSPMITFNNPKANQPTVIRQDILNDWDGSGPSVNGSSKTDEDVKDTHNISSASTITDTDEKPNIRELKSESNGGGDNRKEEASCSLNHNAANRAISPILEGSDSDNEDTRSNASKVTVRVFNGAKEQEDDYMPATPRNQQKNIAPRLRRRKRRASHSSSKSSPNNDNNKIQMSQKQRKRNLSEDFSAKTSDSPNTNATSEPEDEVVNMQLIKNMDYLEVQHYLKWMWKNCRDHFSSNPFIDIVPLMKKILQQPEVYYLIQEKIKEIRSNLYLMESKKTMELFEMISEVVKKIIENDLEEVTRVYHATLNIFSTPGQ